MLAIIKNSTAHSTYFLKASVFFSSLAKAANLFFLNFETASHQQESNTS